MQYDELEALRDKVNGLECNKDISSIINSVDKIDLLEDAQKEVLLFIKKHISTIFTKNDKLNMLNNLLWSFLLIDKNASEELKLTTEKNNGSRFKQVSVDQNLCCIESFEKRIKENGKFNNLEEYTNEMFKKYGVDVIEYCEYDTAIQMKENKSKYIEKYQEEESGEYLKKIGYMKDKNFNSFFKQKSIYTSYTDRPLLAVLSQRAIYLELNSIELPKNLNKVIDALLAGENKIKLMCNMTKHYKTKDANDSVSNAIYREQLIDESSKKFMLDFKDMQKILRRRTIVIEVFQCLICYRIVHHYGVKSYTKALNAVNYLVMKLYVEDNTLFCDEKNQFALENLNEVLIHGQSTIGTRKKLTNKIEVILNLGKIK